MTITLTPIRQKVFEYICAFKRDNDGNSPSVSEIMKGCYFGSTSSVWYCLNSLERLGLIERENRSGKRGSGKSRMIRVVGGQWIAPAGVQADRAASLSSAKE